MNRISIQLEEIKEQMCDARCKWLEKANKTRARSLKEQKQITAMMEEVCAECPLNRL